MAVKIAASSGSPNKVVKSIRVTVDGEWKKAKNGYVAAAQGNIDKQFWGDDWVLHSGTILNDSAGSGFINPGESVTLEASVDESVKPIYIIFNVTYEGYSTSLRFDVSYSMDGITWTDLTSKNINVNTNVPVTTNQQFEMDGDTEVKYIKYKLMCTGSGVVARNQMNGYCSNWYARS